MFGYYVLYGVSLKLCPTIRNVPTYVGGDFEANINPECDFMYVYENDALTAPLTNKSDFHSYGSNVMWAYYSGTKKFFRKIHNA